MDATAADGTWARSFTLTASILSKSFSVAATVLYFVLYPIARLFAVLWYILAFLSSPFIYIGGVVVNIACIPWRIFASFEPLWYFLGGAVLIGLSIGLILHFTLRAFVVVFRLDKKPLPRPIPPTGHSAISYRKAREEKKRKRIEEEERLATQARLIASQPLMQEAVREARKLPLAGVGTTGPLSPVSPTNTLPARPGLLQETILEHSEEDDDDSVF